MKKKINLLIWLSIKRVSSPFYLLNISALLFLTSCSVVGLVIGSFITSKSTSTIRGWQSQKIKIGQELSLRLKNSTEVSGVYKGIDTLSIIEYAAIFESQKIHSANTAFSLKLNDTILIYLKNPNSFKSKNTIRGQFEGIGFNQILIKPDQVSSLSFPLSLVQNVTYNQNHLTSGDALCQLVSSAAIPSRFKILVKNRGTISSIYPEEIMQVTLNKEKIRKGGIGFLLGLGIDIYIIISFVNTFSASTPFFQPNTSFSCPYIYSYDGHQYQLDGETFGGAIFKAAQRTDIDNLDYLKESNGVYKLKLTNELQETQYTDEFKLLVVDHPLNTKVIPGFNGEIYSLNNLQSPIKAIDQNGNDILDLVKSKDDKIWISNPFNRNPEIKSDGRDDIILEFKKPEHTNSVKLAFNVQNTDWAAYLQGHLLSLHGNKLNEWYSLLNNSKAAQSMFKQVMIREGMLLVQLWDGHSWKKVDYVWEVGPRAPKDQVVKLDLSKYEEQNLRIRLESTVGFWMVNSVEADYTPDAPFHITELSASSAKDQYGQNLLSILNKTDENYYTQPSDHDWAEIEFNAIPVQKNIKRTFLLKCNGYYTIHADATGIPQEELINKLIREPGAYGQYTLQMLHQNIANAVIDQKPK